MNGMTDLRVPGLGLAPAMARERSTRQRDSRAFELETSPRTIFQLDRLFDVIRRADGQTAQRARPETATANCSERPLARA